MNKEADHNSRIVDYYGTAQIFYDIFWHGKSHGLHYGFWDPEVKNRQEAIMRENQVLARFAKVHHGDLVLDLGSGISGSGEYLAHRIGAEVVSIDIARKQLIKGRENSTKQKLSKRMSFYEGDYHHLSFKEDTFDVIWSLESIEHSHSVEMLVSEAYRVLKPGGKIVIAGTFKGRDFLSPQEQGQMEIGMDAAGAFNDFRSADNIAGIMRDKGFYDVTNLDQTKQVMESSRQMAKMCKKWMPFAKTAVSLGIVPKYMLLNQRWGIYQESLFESGATSYNSIIAQKPTNSR